MEGTKSEDRGRGRLWIIVGLSLAALSAILFALIASGRPDDQSGATATIQPSTAPAGPPIFGGGPANTDPGNPPDLSGDSDRDGLPSELDEYPPDFLPPPPPPDFIPPPTVTVTVFAPAPPLEASQEGVNRDVPPPAGAQAVPPVVTAHACTYRDCRTIRGRGPHQWNGGHNRTHFGTNSRSNWIDHCNNRIHKGSGVASDLYRSRSSGSCESDNTYRHCERDNNYRRRLNEQGRRGLT